MKFAEFCGRNRRLALMLAMTFAVAVPVLASPGDVMAQEKGAEPAHVSAAPKP